MLVGKHNSRSVAFTTDFDAVYESRGELGNEPQTLPPISTCSLSLTGAPQQMIRSAAQSGTNDASKSGSVAVSGVQRKRWFEQSVREAEQSRGNVSPGQHAPEKSAGGRFGEDPRASGWQSAWMAHSEASLRVCEPVCALGVALD